MTESVLKVFPQEVPEGGSALITGYFEDETGALIPLLGIQTVRLWLDDPAGVTINSRANSDIKNANGGVVAAVTENGVNRMKLTLTLGPADNPFVGTSGITEWHKGLIRVGYNGGVGMLEKPFQLKIVALDHVP